MERSRYSGAGLGHVDEPIQVHGRGHHHCISRHCLYRLSQVINLHQQTHFTCVLHGFRPRAGRILHQPLCRGVQCCLVRGQCFLRSPIETLLDMPPLQRHYVTLVWQAHVGQSVYQEVPESCTKTLRIFVSSCLTILTENRAAACMAHPTAST